MLLVWSVVFALLYLAIRRGRAGAITVGALVFSHYVLDVITHRPDMPITIDGPARLGLGLWNYPGTTLATESAMFIIGTAIYSSVTRERDRTGRIALLALMATLVAIYFAALWGPPPPSSQAVAIAGHLSWLFVLWAYWVDAVIEARVARVGLTRDQASRSATSPLAGQPARERILVLRPRSTP